MHSSLLSSKGAGPLMLPRRGSSTGLRCQVAWAQNLGVSHKLRLQASNAVSGATPPVTRDVLEADGKEIMRVDPNLESCSEHLQYRWDTFQNLLSRIEDAEGSILEFAKGHHKMGITREGNALVYREWAPAAAEAYLIGEFNGWSDTEMKRDEFGVWSVTIPDREDGSPGIPHNSKLKIKLRKGDGHYVCLLPAWIKFAVQDFNVAGAGGFDGVHWDPPDGQAYKFKNPRPAAPESLRIYEAHVGMSSEEPLVASYTHFRENVLPRIKSQGYNCVQIMAIQEHAYYGSFGYHVTNPFAASSRQGDPEELKALVDAAHGMGLLVLLDVVHSHISSNGADGLAGFDLGQREEDNYFRQGAEGYQAAWDSRCLNYKHWETLRYLLSNLRFWVEDYQFDGFRFDGVTSMLYHHHGINIGFSGNYEEYFSHSTNVDAIVYLMLANHMLSQLLPGAITIAEDVSGMPALCRPVYEGGVGFDYRLAMAVPDKWIKLLKHTPDEMWSMSELVATLCNRRYTEKTVGYAESHDQAMVGDKTIAMWLLDAEIYTGMSTFNPVTTVVERGLALHKMIRAITATLGGEAYLAFMGNEFGHPEWLDFPREGNGWSHAHARRQWSLCDDRDLRYRFMNEFDKDLMALDDQHNFISNSYQDVVRASDGEQVLVAERGPLVWVFNFSPSRSYEGYAIGVSQPGKYRAVLSSDDHKYEGQGRVGAEVDHFTDPEPMDGKPQSMKVCAPSRTAVAYARMDD